MQPGLEERKLSVEFNTLEREDLPRQRKRLQLTGRIVCIGMSSGIKDGKRSFYRIAGALLSMPRISILRLFNDNTGVYALNALHVLRDPSWIAKLTSSMTTIQAMGLEPHVGKVFDASDIGLAHDFLSSKQATGKVLIAWPKTDAN